MGLIATLCLLGYFAVGVMGACIWAYHDNYFHRYDPVVWAIISLWPILLVFFSLGQLLKYFNELGEKSREAKKDAYWAKEEERQKQELKDLEQYHKES